MKQRTEENTPRDKIIVRTSLVGIGANVFLAAFKTLVGLASHSIAIVLDAVNNLSDAGSSLITILSAKLAGKQPDRKHPWGYGRVEYLSAMVISLIVLYAGITSLTESIRAILHPETPSYTWLALLIILVGVAVKALLGRYVKSVGQKVRSESLVNSGQDAALDAIISASTLVAALIYLSFGVSLEAWLGAVISILIIKSGIEMLRSTLSEILGERVEAQTAREVRDTLMAFPEIHGVYDMIFHDYGPDRLNCSAHIEVDDTMTAAQIDRLQRAATSKLYAERGIILTALSVYSVNTKDPEAIALREEVYRMAMAHEHVLQVHGFYYSPEEKRLQFDVIVDFDVEDRTGLFEQVIAEVKEKYPDMEVSCTLDTDFADNYETE
ncbi:MAG: cation transporter [Clostridia bacterium]|nr:cation transporter [Clostridia bacterium]